MGTEQITAALHHTLESQKSTVVLVKTDSSYMQQVSQQLTKQ